MKNDLNRYVNTRVNQYISSLVDDSDTVSYASNIANKHQSHEKKQKKLTVVPNYVRTAHIERVACPLHIIELTKNLKKIDISETLRIIVGSHAVTLELLSACHTLGHETLIVENNGRKELLVTRKK